MDTHKYKCNYCHEEYIPKRRYVQRFCCDSCRSKYHHQRVKNNNKLKSNDEENKNKKIGKVDKMSLAGVGNAAAGTLAAKGLMNLFIKEGDKPATKNDLLKLLNKLDRYQKINNLPLNIYNKNPYFDMKFGTVVYF